MSTFSQMSRYFSQKVNQLVKRSHEPFSITYPTILTCLILISVLTGVLFSTGKLLGLDLGQAAAQNKVRFLIMSFNYLFVHLTLLIFLIYQTLFRKNHRNWLFIIGYIIIYALLFGALNNNISEVFYLYLRIAGVLFFYFPTQK